VATALSNEDKRKIRNLAERKSVTVDWLKIELNNAVQGVEDWWELAATQLSISSAIDSATTFNFTNAQKKVLVKFWLQNRSDRE
jgi:hypothetical protein